MKLFLGLCKYSEYKKLNEKLISLEDKYIQLLKNKMNLNIEYFSILDEHTELILEKNVLEHNMDNIKRLYNVYKELREEGEDLDFLEYILNIKNQQEEIQC